MGIRLNLSLLLVAGFLSLPADALAQAHHLYLAPKANAPQQASPQQSVQSTDKAAIPASLQGNPQLEGLWHRYQAIEAAAPSNVPAAPKPNKTQLFSSKGAQPTQVPSTALRHMQGRTASGAQATNAGQTIINKYKQAQKQQQEMHSLHFPAPNLNAAKEQ